MAEFPSTSDLLGAGTGLEARGLFSQEFSAIRQLPGAQPAESVSIGGGGTITPSSAFVEVASAGTVQLISTANTHAGMEIKLIAGSGLAVTIKHDPGSTGGIALSKEVDLSLPSDRFITLKRAADRWIEIVPYGADGDSGGGGEDVVIPTGSQNQAGILRLALDSEVQGDNITLAATAGQVAGAKTAAAIANAGVSTVNGRVDELELRVGVLDDSLNSSSPGKAEIMIVADQKARGTTSGTSIANTWQLRDLNTIRVNTISGASLADNVITLPKGAYEVRCDMPSQYTNRHQAGLYVNGALHTLGNTASANASAPGTSLSIVSAYVALTETSELSVMHWTYAARADNAWGPEKYAGTAPEIYATVTIRRIS